MGVGGVWSERILGREIWDTYVFAYVCIPGE